MIFTLYVYSMFHFETIIINCLHRKDFLSGLLSLATFLTEICINKYFQNLHMRTHTSLVGACQENMHCSAPQAPYLLGIPQ